MKKVFFSAIALFTLLLSSIAQNANRALSNLTSPTAVNQNLVPGTNGTLDLGSPALGWRNGFFTNTLFTKSVSSVDVFSGSLSH